MSLKMKLTSTIIAFMLLASMLIVGVFAVKKTEFSVGGNIVFNATGIDATISAGTLSTTGSWRTGDGTGKMEEVVIDTDKSASDLATKYATWSGLDLAFNEAGDDVTITFTITNNSTNADDSLVAYVNVDNGTNKNAVAYVKNAGAVIAPNTTEATDENVQIFVITFHIIDKEVNAALEGFKIDFDIRYSTVEAESSTDTTLSYEGITYSMGTNNTLSITGKDGSPTNVVVPAYIKNGETIYSVTSIGMSVFNGCTSLTNISIPNSVTNISMNAFSGCTGLANISIPNSVRGILNAFSGCTSLTSITIPSSVTSIGMGEFKGCNGLASIVVEEENTVYDSRNNCNAVINTSSNELVFGCKNTTIPNGIASIGNDAFSGCTSLTSITIPSSVTSIGMGAFNGCTSLTSIIIPSSITSIGPSAFSNCTSLESITIPESMTSIGMNAFNGCSNLTEVTIDSQNIVAALTSVTACEKLIENATTINVRADLTPSDYLKGLTSGGTTVIDGVTYNVYTK